MLTVFLPGCDYSSKPSRQTLQGWQTAPPCCCWLRVYSFILASGTLLWIRVILPNIFQAPSQNWIIIWASNSVYKTNKREMALFILCEINQTYILPSNESMALSAVILSLKRGFVPLFYVSFLYVWWSACFTSKAMNRFVTKSCRSYRIHMIRTLIDKVDNTTYTRIPRSFTYLTRLTIRGTYLAGIMQRNTYLPVFTW
jgi:hypothetical protein